MIKVKLLRYCGIIAILLFIMALNNLILARGIPEIQKGTIMIEGQELRFEKAKNKLVISDLNGKVVFQWMPERKNVALIGFDYSNKNKGFVVLTEIFDPKKKTYSLICIGPNFNENIQTDTDMPFREAVYFEMGDGAKWVVFLTKVSDVSSYSFVCKRLLAWSQYRTPVVGIGKAKIGGENFLIIKKKEKGDIVRLYKRKFTGHKPYNNPLLLMQKKDGEAL